MAFVWRRRSPEPQPVDWSPVHSRTLRLIVLPAIAVALLAACSSGPTPAASVGETDITEQQLAHDTKLFTFLAALNQQQCGGPPPQGETQETACGRFTLGNMIQGELVDRYATEHDITVKASEVDDIVANLDEQLTAEAVDAELAKQGLTRADLEELANQVLLFQAVQTAVAEEELGDEQLRQIYDEQILQFTTIEALHILVDTEAEADDVYQQVTAPDATQETFEDLAKDVSTDTASGANGGSLGQSVASTYVPEFGEAAVALEPGEISEPVQSEFGWHVIYLVDEQVTPFEEAKTQLLSGEQGTLFNAWMRDEAESLGVEVNPTWGRFDAETLTVVAVNSTDGSATSAPAEGAPSDGGEGTPAP
jgi:parvulin-like peptidyl-prolyl isomerase